MRADLKLRVSLTFVLVTAALGCGKDDGGSAAPPAKGAEPAKPTPGPAPAPVPAPAGGVGTITGTVKFEGAPPVMPDLDRKADAFCAKTPMKAHWITVAAEGGLKDVLVKLPAGAAKGAVPAGPLVIDQKQCVYLPYVNGVVVGQKIAYRNSDATMHNVHLYSGDETTYNGAMAAGAKDILRDPEGDPGDMMKVKCDAHSWMESWIHISDHPFFAVSDAGGAFTIAGVPAGEYELEAWHPRLGSRKAKVTVKPGESATVSFAPFTPVPQ